MWHFKIELTSKRLSYTLSLYLYKPLHVLVGDFLQIIMIQLKITCSELDPPPLSLLLIPCAYIYYGDFHSGSDSSPPIDYELISDIDWSF